MIIRQDGIALKHDLITLNGYHFSCIFIHEVFHPFAENPCGKFAADQGFQLRFGNLHFFGKIKYLENIFVRFKTNGTQKGSNREFFTAVYVCEHYIIHIRSKFHPGAFERDNPRRIEAGTVGMEALREEYARRTVKLGYNYTL